jgi:predicted ribonuclease YlaK
MRTLLDTNILLDSPLTIKQDNIALHISSLRELDRLKTKDGETGYKARRASKLIKKNISNITFYDKKYWQKEVDDILIMCAYKNKMKLATNDVVMEIKAKAKNIEVVNFGDLVEETYAGIINYVVNFDHNMYNSEVEVMLQTKRPPMKMHENEFLIIRDGAKVIEYKGQKEYEPYLILKYKNGELGFVKDTRAIESDYSSGAIKPRNVEQKCFIDLLQDKDVTILSINGGYGTGKTFLTVHYALQQLGKGNIDKIIFIPNNSQVESTKELAALPGGIVEKELPYLGAFIDIAGKDNIAQLVMQDQIEILPMAVARGRNLEKCIIIVNEAQNLIGKQIKLLIGRCGDKSRIIFDGDIAQADAEIFKTYNGLKLLLKLRNSGEFSSIFGCVKLKTIERSKTANASDYLDSIEG